MEEQSKSSDGTVTLKKSTIWKISTFVFAGLFIISLFTGGFGLGSNDITGGVVAPSNPTPTPTLNVNAKDFVGNDDPILGDPNAKITIVEFSDFQCPFCKRAADDAVKQLIDSDYFKDGDVNLVFRDFPLTSIHPFAQKAAEAGQCAYDQEKFWEYHDLLFANQGALDTASLKQYATDLELDTDKFNECLDSGENKDEVAKDLEDAQKAGGRGTPYFIVGNVPVSGAQPFSAFEAAIQAQL